MISNHVPSRRRTCFTLWFAVTVLLLASSPAAVSAGPPLPEAAPDSVAAGEDSWVVRTRALDFDPGLLAPPDQPEGVPALTLDLFPEVTVTAQRVGFQRRSDRSYTWFGRATEDEPAGVVLTVVEGRLLGYVAAGGREYEILPAPDGGSLVRQLEAGLIPDEDCRPADTTPAADGPATASGDSGEVIDVMVVYTHAASLAVGDVEALAQLAVDQANLTFANSGIEPRLRLVHTQEVDYTETGNLGTDVRRLRQPADGFLDTVHTLRDDYAADLVVLMTRKGRECGKPYAIMSTVAHAFEANAFAVVRVKCAVASRTLTHELGHLMSARHDWAGDPTRNKPFGYNHGYVNYVKRWRTMMTDNASCRKRGFSCQRLLYFSNPDNVYGGRRMGVPEGKARAADNRKALNNTAATVAGFREGAYLTLTAPNGGESWEQGAPQTITWETSGPVGATVSLRLYKGDVPDAEIAAATDNDGAYPWVVPPAQAPGGDYRVRVESVFNPRIFDLSDADFAVIPGETLTVTAPNGGETWVANTSQTITWTTSGTPSPQVNIELLKGGVFHSSVAAGTANDGSHDWAIPLGLTGGNDYTVRIASTANPLVADQSDGNFTIVIPELLVTSPVGGERWRCGSTYPVTWSSGAGVGTTVRIELHRDGLLADTIASSTSNDGSYDWHIPLDTPAGVLYRIKVISTANPGLSDRSDADFTIDPLQLTITNPVPGASWRGGDYRDVTWTASSLEGFIRLELWKGGLFQETIASGIGNDGEYQWHLDRTYQSASDYQVKAVLTVNPEASAFSGSFSILPMLFTFAHPTGGVTWRMGEYRDISWTSSVYQGTVRLEAWKGELFLENIVTGIGNDGEYQWHLPLDYVPGPDYRIRIVLTDNPETEVFSPLFTVAVLELEVLAPDGGESWQAGTQHTISWSSNPAGQGNVRIDLLKGGAVNRNIYSGGANDGIYLWTIPGALEAGSDYRVRITLTTNAASTDESDGNFTVTPP
jgi:hypothetical protein